MLKLTSFITRVLKETVLNLYSPKNIRLNWNWGSFLGIVVVVQIGTGVLLTFFYSSDPVRSFMSIELMVRINSLGIITRWIHLNLASLFFLLIYLHIFRGLFYSSYNLKDTWLSGMRIFIILMLTAFVGYVLPWNQISYWAATVITKFLSVIPMIGQQLVVIVWSGFRLRSLTLKIFYRLHFILPFIILGVLVVHLIGLHMFGSTSTILLNHPGKIKFTPRFLRKDSVNLQILVLLLVVFNLWGTFEAENFLESDYLVSPLHIKPEWYFLFAYAILRSIPQKLLGVIAIVVALAAFFILPTITIKFKLSSVSLLNKTLFFGFIVNFTFLSWIGGNPVNDLFISLGQVSTVLYFFLFLLFTTRLRLIKLVY